MRSPVAGPAVVRRSRPDGFRGSTAASRAIGSISGGGTPAGRGDRIVGGPGRSPRRRITSSIARRAINSSS